MQNPKLSFEELPGLISDLAVQISQLILELKATRAPERDSSPLPRKEIMKRYSTTAPTLIRLEKSGRITALRLGSRAYYYPNEVEAAMVKPTTKDAKKGR